MVWNDVLTFSRGPLFYAALIVLIGGMLYRLMRILMLGWSKDRISAKGSKAGGIVKTYAKGILVWPFIPWVKRTFSHNPVIYLAGGLFHLSLFTVLILGTAHMLVWKSLLGIVWWTLPLPIVDWMAAIGIAALLVLLLHRIVNPVMKLITGPAEWTNWSLVFLPMITGYIMTHHLFFRYEVLFSLHMLSVDLLLIWIPFSRIAHFMFYFFSRTIHGTEFGKRGVNP
jgi:nitrate reductase gamma subunit